MLAKPWLKSKHARSQTVLASAGADGSSAAVKYLSSSKLLRLQLQDAGLRRHFLLQVLIFLHAVRHVGKQPLKAASPVLKDRQASPRAPTACSTAMVPSLSPEVK